MECCCKTGNLIKIEITYCFFFPPASLAKSLSIKSKSACGSPLSGASATSGSYSYSPFAFLGLFAIYLRNPKRINRHMKQSGMPQNDLMVLTPLMPPRTTNTIAITANTMPQNSLSHTGGSWVSSEPSMDMPARVTAIESHCVTSDMVIIISMIIFAIVLSGRTLNMDKVNASAPSFR